MSREKGFDLVTHKRNKKGQVTSTNHYTLHIENGMRKYERPKGSKMFYSEDGTLLSSPKKTAKEVMSPEVKKTLVEMAEKEMAKDE